MTCSDDSRNGRIVLVTRAATIFDAVVNALLGRVRQAMSVPEVASEATEAQFRELREKLDAFFPEFRNMYGSLLSQSLGERHVDAVLAGLEAPALQAFFGVSVQIDAELRSASNDLMREMAEYVCELAQREADLTAEHSRLFAMA
jgi:hypothetical protein